MGQITVTQNEGYVEYHFIGSFDDVSLYQAVREIWTADNYEPTQQELYDLRGGDFTLITGTAIRKITDLNQQLHAEAPQLRHAMLTIRDLQYGFSRMLTTLNENRNPNVRVFRDRDEAIAWVSSEGAPPS